MMKKIFSASLLLSLLFSRQAFAANLGTGDFFNDVKGSDSYDYQIDWLADNGVIRGYDDGTFKPGQCVNRAEFLKMLYATRQADVSTPNPSAMYLFSDVDLKAWYWPYLRYAITNGIVQGYPDKTFRPANCVNRVEAVKMAVLEFHNGKVPEAWGALQTTLVDVAPNAWYSAMMEYAYDAHILGLTHLKTVTESISGGSAKYFPSEPMSRGEVAYLLYMIKALVDNDVAAHDSSIWANGKQNVLYNEERGVLMPKQHSDAYAFDGCGKMSDTYAKASWYAGWKKIATDAGIDVMKISDACFSAKAGVLVFMIPGDYAEMANIYKYDTKVSGKDSLSKASLIPSDRQWFASPEKFGKRIGNFIRLVGMGGDAGCSSEQHFEYFFEKNVIRLVKEGNYCVNGLTDEKEPTTWMYY